MNKVTIIYGSDKTLIHQLSDNLSIGHKTEIIDYSPIGLKGFGFYYCMSPNYTLIIFRDIDISIIPAILTQAYQKTILVNNPGGKPLVIERPEIIIAIECSEKDLKQRIGNHPRFEYIQINSVEDYIKQIKQRFTVEKVADIAIDLARQVLHKYSA